MIIIKKKNKTERRDGKNATSERGAPEKGGTGVEE